MLILGIDSAGSGCGVALWQDGTILKKAEEPMERGQDQRLVPMVMDVMREAGFDFPALDRIAVTKGPGSFTGLRIGLATARGLGLAAAKPVLGLDRFSIYRAQTTGSEKNLLVVINSRRAELFCRFYPSRGAPGEPMMLTPDAISTFVAQHDKTMIAGDGPLPGLTVEAPRESEVITLAGLAARATPDQPEFLPRPLYIREPDVTFPSQKATR
jgi:tRNA threonylcarbamoyladenosine biosynthesis protein TsaB